MAQYSIGDAIKKMIEQSHWKHSYLEVKLREDWELIMGKTVAKHTNDLHIQQGKLFIYTNTAPLKNELNYNKSTLIQRINEHFGENFITDVVIV